MDSSMKKQPLFRIVSNKQTKQKISTYKTTVALALFVLLGLLVNLYFKHIQLHLNKLKRVHLFENTLTKAEISPPMSNSVKQQKIMEYEFEKIIRNFQNRYCDTKYLNLKAKIDIELNVPKIIRPFQLYLNSDTISNFIQSNNLTNTTSTDYIHNLLEVNRGGRWAPRHCRVRHKVAIVVPYRDREDNLNTFLYNMHTFLQRQELSYAVFVVEQVNEAHFNKGTLMNAAFIEIFIKNRFKLSFDCIVYHDVDVK
jgi:hypothetical protein